MSSLSDLLNKKHVVEGPLIDKFVVVDLMEVRFTSTTSKSGALLATRRFSLNVCSKDICMITLIHFKNYL